MAAEVHSFKINRSGPPPAGCRLGLVGATACLLATAVIYSRDGRIAINTEAIQTNSKQTFMQPEKYQHAEVRATPTPKVLAVPEDDRLQIATVLALPRPRPVTPGYYYERVRAQGDGVEGEYELTERKCIPKVDMPQPCYLPERGRQNFPIRRE